MESFNLSKYITDGVNSVLIYLYNPNDPSIIGIKDSSESILKQLNSLFGESNIIDTIEYHQCDMIYSYDKISDGQKVYKKILKIYDIAKGIYSFDEEQLPTHRFPCIDSIVFKSNIKRYSYRINNRMYLNYEEDISESESEPEKFKYIYINYKHSELIDLKKMNSDYERVNKMLKKLHFNF
jgi:hypothetical protein